MTNSNNDLILAKAEELRSLIEQQTGAKAFVMAATVQPNNVRRNPGMDVTITRAISDGTTREHGKSWIDVLQRETIRVGKLLGGV